MRINLILLVVALVLAYPTWRTFENDRISFTDYSEIPLLYPGFTPANVSRVVISTPKRDDAGEPVRDEAGNLQRENLLLMRVDDRWVLGQGSRLAGLKVVDDSVRERVLRHLESIRVDEKELVHKQADPDTLARFGLDEASATLIQAFNAANAPLAELMLGHDASGGRFGQDVVRGFYVRSKDSSDVVLYEQSHWAVSPDPETWVDRNPLRFRAEHAVALSLRNEFGSVSVKKDAASDLDWVFEAASAEVGAVRSGEIATLLRSLAMLSVQKYVEPIPQNPAAVDGFLSRHGLLKPKIAVTIGLEDGTTHEIHVGKQVSGSNEFYLRLSGVPFLMTVWETAISAADRDPTQAFFDPPESAVRTPRDGDDRGGAGGAPTDTGKKDRGEAEDGVPREGGTDAAGAGTDPAKARAEGPGADPGDPAKGGADPKPGTETTPGPGDPKAGGPGRESTGGEQGKGAGAGGDQRKQGDQKTGTGEQP